MRKIEPIARISNMRSGQSKEEGRKFRETIKKMGTEAKPEKEFIEILEQKMKSKEQKNYQKEK